jgi:hypothetical protein
MALSDIEVTCLRNELIKYEDQIVDLTKFAITASSILLGFGLSQSGPAAGFIVLVPLVVIAPLLQLMLNRHLNIVRVATYLWAFAGESFRFEERLWKFRKDSVLPRGSFATGTRGLLLMIGFVCILLSFVLLRPSGSSMLLPSIAVVLWSGFAIVHYRDWQRVQLGGNMTGECIEGEAEICG